MRNSGVAAAAAAPGEVERCIHWLIDSCWNRQNRGEIKLWLVTRQFDGSDYTVLLLEWRAVSAVVTYYRRPAIDYNVNCIIDPDILRNIIAFSYLSHNIVGVLSQSCSPVQRSFGESRLIPYKIAEPNKQYSASFHVVCSACGCWRVLGHCATI